MRHDWSDPEGPGVKHHAALLELFREEISYCARSHFQRSGKRGIVFMKGIVLPDFLYVVALPDSDPDIQKRLMTYDPETQALVAVQGQYDTRHIYTIDLEGET